MNVASQNKHGDLSRNAPWELLKLFPLTLKYVKPEDTLRASPEELCGLPSQKGQISKGQDMPTVTEDGARRAFLSLLSSPPLPQLRLLWHVRSPPHAA